MSVKKHYLTVVTIGLVGIVGAITYLKIQDINTNNANTDTSQDLPINPQDKVHLPAISPSNSQSNPKLPLVQPNTTVVSSVLNSATLTPNSANTSLGLLLEEDKQRQKILEEQKLKQAQEKESKKEQEELDNKRLQEEATKKIKEAEKIKADALKQQQDLALKEALLKEQVEKNKKIQLESLASNKVAGNNLCLSYGPMSIDIKKRFVNILTANKVKSFDEFQFPQYEIYWNLGKNKFEALEKFEHQKKEGALRNEQFKLTQDNEGNWIVPATTIAGDYSIAEKLAQQLTASSSKFGGKWQIREKVGGYYISIKNTNTIPEQVLFNIDRELRLNKTFCDKA